MPVFQRLTANLSTTDFREETLEGRSYLVVPGVLMVEGVHEGSDGPGYYPADELSQACPTWNHKPITLYHPKDRDGNPGSASDTVVINKQKMGFILNTRMNESKQTTEFWFDKRKTRKVDKRVYSAIINKQAMEVSTGLYLNQEKTKGKWKDEEYSWIGRQHRPDHIAILPDKTGACSIKDGAGLFANEASFGSIHQMLRNALSTKYGEPGRYWYGYLEEVFKTYCIFCNSDGKMYKVGYTATDTSVTLDGEAQEVRRATQYKAVSNDEVVGNCSLVLISNVGVQMADKKKVVDKIINHQGSAWDESDREHLMSKSDDKLDAIIKGIEGDAKKLVVKEEPKNEPKEEPVKNAKKESEVVQSEKLKLTKTELFEMMGGREGVMELLGADFVAVHNQGQKVLNATKDALIKRITTNAKNRFKEDYLKKKDVEELEAIAALLPADDAGSDRFLPSYLGASVPGPTANELDDEPLVFNSRDSK